MNNFNMCPMCGKKNITCPGNRKWFCSDCGFDLYNNTATAVGLIIVNERDEVLFEKRAKEPRRGFLAFPGGFVDYDETAEQACIRECREELGVDIDSLKYICSFPNTYQYKNITYKTCDLFFEAKINKGAAFKIDDTEVSSLEWIKITTEADVEKLPLAFASADKTLRKWIKNGRKND